MTSRVPIVEKIYAAFGRGDLPAILEPLAEDVDWEYSIGPNEVPWLQRRRGRAEVPKFFAAIAAHLDLLKFVPKTFLEAPGVVVAMIDVELRVKASGRVIAEEDELHVWRFDQAGRIVRFKHGVDTLQHALAIR